jgi:hypothetical protein
MKNMYLGELVEWVRTTERINGKSISFEKRVKLYLPYILEYALVNRSWDVIDDKRLRLLNGYSQPLGIIENLDNQENNADWLDASLVNKEFPPNPAGLYCLYDNGLEQSSIQENSPEIQSYFERLEKLGSLLGQVPVVFK